MPILAKAGFAATVPAACAEVRGCCHYVAVHDGGNGAVREVCELILRAQGSYQRLVAEYQK